MEVGGQTETNLDDHKASPRVVGRGKVDAGLPMGDIESLDCGLSCPNEGSS